MTSCFRRNSDFKTYIDELRRVHFKMFFSNSNKIKSSSGVLCSEMHRPRFIEGDKGSAAVEAAVAVPLFLFVLLFLFHLLHVSTVRQVIYEAGAEAAEYAAEYCFLQETGHDVLQSYGIGADAVQDPSVRAGDDSDGSSGLVDSALILAVASHTLHDSIDEKEMVGRYVQGGVKGITLLGSELPREDGELVFHISYTICIDTPFLPTVTKRVEETIRQRPYTGKEVNTEEGIESDPYVYVTDNREVYHRNRGCTHIFLGIHATSKEEALRQGYHACDYCGDKDSPFVMVGPEGDCYHCNANCRGLKRTVHRIRLSEVGGIPPCSRCGN